MKLCPSGEELIIEAGSSNGAYWRELWRYRELFWFLAWRDILVRYKETVVGLSWSILRPLLAMLAFTLVFHRFARLESGGVPYPLLVLTGLLPWQFFSNAISESGNSLVNNAGLISKIYFPRMIIPASSIVTGVVEFAVSGALLGILFQVYGVLPGWRVIFLPIVIALLLALTAGAGLWLSALTVRFRDMRVVLPFLVQFGFFISPVGYSNSVVPQSWRLLYSLNPLAGVIDGFRWVLLPGPHEIFWPGIILSAVAGAVLLLSGIAVFRRTERLLADVI